MASSSGIVKVAMNFSNPSRHNSKFNSQTYLDFCCCSELAHTLFLNLSELWSASEINVVNSGPKHTQKNKEELLQQLHEDCKKWALKSLSWQRMCLNDDRLVGCSRAAKCKPNGGVFFDFELHDSRVFVRRTKVVTPQVSCNPDMVHSTLPNAGN